MVRIWMWYELLNLNKYPAQIIRSICKARLRISANSTSKFTSQHRHGSTTASDPRFKARGLLFASVGVLVTTIYALSTPLSSDSKKSSFEVPDAWDILDLELTSRYFGKVVSSSASGLRRFDILSVARFVVSITIFSY